MQGLHITGDLFNCDCLFELLVDLPSLNKTCIELTRESGLTVVDDRFFLFPDYNGEPGGITGTVLLAESHLCIHTWPERRGVTLDVYVCNFTRNNSAKAEQLFESLVKLFKPYKLQINRLHRAAMDSGEVSLD